MHQEEAFSVSMLLTAEAILGVRLEVVGLADGAVTYTPVFSDPRPGAARCALVPQFDLRMTGRLKLMQLFRQTHHWVPAEQRALRTLPTLPSEPVAAPQGYFLRTHYDLVHLPGTILESEKLGWNVRQGRLKMLYDQNCTLPDNYRPRHVELEVELQGKFKFGAIGSGLAGWSFMATPPAAWPFTTPSASTNTGD